MVVAVDPETGRVELVDYVVVHEAGRIVNPMIADAQIVGGGRTRHRRPIPV